MSCSASAPLPTPQGPKYAYHWGYKAIAQGMPEDWEAHALALGARFAEPYPDPNLRPLIVEVVRCAQWSLALSILRARHLNWAIDLHNGDFPRAVHFLGRYPTTERAFSRARARVDSALARALRHFNDYKSAPSDPDLVDSSSIPSLPLLLQTAGDGLPQDHPSPESFPRQLMNSSSALPHESAPSASYLVDSSSTLLPPPAPRSSRNRPAEARPPPPRNNHPSFA